LFLISSAALYFEIVLIRWLGTEVKIFAFFQNLSLIVCFLGFGVGCFSSRKRGSLTPSIAAATALVVIVGLPFTAWKEFLKGLSGILAFSPDAALWGAVFIKSRQEFYELFVVSLFVVAIFLMLVTIAMIPLGRWVAYYLEQASDTVGAYSINLFGSLVGIWFLALIAFFWLPPYYWFAAAFVLILFCQPVSIRSVLITAVLLAITLFFLRPAPGRTEYWSPYQKLTVIPKGNQEYGIDVNDNGYMSIANVTPQYLAINPVLARLYQNSSYDSPFQFAPNVNNVLIIGAGAGNDVAAALRHGANHVDAIEIDPLISSIGRRLHPEKPYSSPRVHLVNNDARNYMRTCREKYDVIIFGLLDSHTEFSGYSNVRVDNYVYTEESFREARNLLNPNGILILKFEVRYPWTWMGQRFFGILSDVFPQPPLTYFAAPIGYLTSATVFIESNSPAVQLSSLDAAKAAFVKARPASFPLSLADAPAPTTDDWPYVYHRSHTIPRAYFAVSAVILILALYMIGPLFKPKESSTWIFFFLGAGFLLMETQLVSRLGLYFGTTWIVNCFALTGVLTVLLLANFYVSHRRPEKLSAQFVCLCLALVVVYAVPWNKIPGSGTFVGILIGIAFCVPILFAGIIFAELFRRLEGNNAAFGANMLGAVAGGLAQNLSFIFGMKALLLLAALLYAAVCVLQISRKAGVPTPGVGVNA
jgi:spermidine synthase